MSIHPLPLPQGPAPKVSHLARLVLLGMFLAVSPVVLGAALATPPQKPESETQLVDRLLSLPNYVPNPRMRGPDERTPLLRDIQARGEQGAAAMVARLMAMPGSTEVPQGTKNSMRWQLVRDIGTLGDAAIHPAQQALKNAQTDLQRQEMVSAISSVDSPAATQAMLELLPEKDDTIRSRAISLLTDRLGVAPELGGSEEILPVLAEDLPGEKDEQARISVCARVVRVLKPIPPADKPDPRLLTLATAMLRERLKNDSSSEVRFFAACRLTEFGDNSGLAELKQAALALQAAGSVTYGVTLESIRNESRLDLLVPALERASGHTFGRVPMNPTLSSDTRTVPKLEADRKALLEKVVAWVKANPDTPATRPAAETPSTIGSH